MYVYIYIFAIYILFGTIAPFYAWIIMYVVQVVYLPSCNMVIVTGPYIWLDDFQYIDLDETIYFGNPFSSNNRLYQPCGFKNNL